ncbi:MAG: hypothetical protein MJ196_03395 [Treponemataceae bacterium]|nr:hypothetical protein [Treponemataceae bacterium]
MPNTKTSTGFFKFSLLMAVFLHIAAAAHAQLWSQQHINSASIFGYLEAQGLSPKILLNRSQSTDFSYNILIEFAEAGTQENSYIIEEKNQNNEFSGSASGQETENNSIFNKAFDYTQGKAKVSAKSLKQGVKKIWRRFDKEKESDFSKIHLIIALSQENLPFFLNDFVAFTQKLQKQPPAVPVTIFLSAGDTRAVPSFGSSSGTSMEGTKQFISYSNLEDNCAVFILQPQNSFNSNKYTKEINLVPGIPFNASPAWLLKALYAGAQSKNKSISIDGSFLTFYRIGLLQRERVLGEYLDADIPGVLLECKDSSVFDIFDQIMVMFEKQKNEEWDKHYTFFPPTNINDGKPLFVPESFLLLILLLVSFSALLYLIFFPFWGKKTGALHYRDLQSSWFLIPLLVFITWALLHAAQMITLKLFPNWFAHISYAISLKAGFSIVLLVIVSFFHRFVKFPTRDYIYGYLLNIMAFADLFIFSFLDLSLVVIFCAQLLLCLAFSHTKKVSSLIFLGIMLLLPFSLLLNVAFTMPRQNILYRFFYSSLMDNFLLACLILPVEFAWMRVIVHIGSFGRERKIRFPFIAIGVLSVCVAAILYIFANTAAQERIEIPNFEIQQTANQQLFVKSQNQSFMDRTLIKLEIETVLPAIKYEVNVSVEKGIAVYDANFPFESSDNDKKASIILGDYPPNPLEIMYTTERGGKSTIEVTSFVRSSQGSLLKETQTLIIEP